MTLAQYLSTMGETQSSFAARAGMSRHTIHRLMNGRHWPKAETVLDIYQATDGLVTLWDVTSLRAVLDCSTPRNKAEIREG